MGRFVVAFRCLKMAPERGAASLRQMVRRGKTVELGARARGFVRHSGGVGIFDQFAQPTCQQLYAIIGLHEAAQHLRGHDVGYSFVFGYQGDLVIGEIAVVKTIAHG